MPPSYSQYAEHPPGMQSGNSQHPAGSRGRSSGGAALRFGTGRSPGRRVGGPSDPGPPNRCHSSCALTSIRIYQVGASRAEPSRLSMPLACTHPGTPPATCSQATRTRPLDGPPTNLRLNASQFVNNALPGRRPTHNGTSAEQFRAEERLRFQEPLCEKPSPRSGRLSGPRTRMRALPAVRIPLK